MLLWPRLVCGSTAVPQSSPGQSLPKPSGRRGLEALGALLVSPFNVKWRFSAPAGGVEGSKLCLFSVIMPAKCVSSVSPRFYYRRLAFCFFPLATILEFGNFYCDKLKHTYMRKIWFNCLSYIKLKQLNILKLKYKNSIRIFQLYLYLKDHYLRPC
jgi:hypothetical protein